MRLRTDSASRRSCSAVEPIRSAKTTVTTLRASVFGTAGAATLAPQASQNLAAGRRSPPQLAQCRTRGAAQSSQNFAPERFSWLQAEQIMPRVVQSLWRGPFTIPVATPGRANELLTLLVSRPDLDVAGRAGRRA